MRRFELAVDAVKRMRYRVRNSPALQIALERKNIVANNRDVGVVFFRDAPNQNVDLAGVLREISRDLLADESLRQVGDLQTAVDRVVIGDRDKIHASFEQLPMQFPWIGIRIGKVETPKEPFLRAGAEAGMNVEVTFAHIYLERALSPFVGDPVLIRRRCSVWSHLTDKIDNLPPNGRMRKVRRVNTKTHQ